MTKLTAILSAIAFVLLSQMASAEIVALPETVMSKEGLYKVELKAEDMATGVGPIHAWVATVTDSDGKPVEDAKIAVNGGMPGHGHGLPTAPEMTEVLGPGVYKIDGVKFSMVGAWELRLTIEAPAGTDEAVFAFEVK